MSWPDYPATWGGNGKPEQAVMPVPQGFAATPAPQVDQSATERPKETGKKEKRVRLSDLPSVRRELAKIYSLARSGQMEPQTASRLAYLLDLMAKIMEKEALQGLSDRLEAIERRPGR